MSPENMVQTILNIKTNFMLAENTVQKNLYVSRKQSAKKSNLQVNRKHIALFSIK